MTTDNMTTKQVSPEIIAQWATLLKELQGDIGDEYRCTDDPDDDTPGMLVTFGYTPESEDKDDKDEDESWSYQTGDNSYSGGAYGHPYWGLAYLYRDTDCVQAAQEAANEIDEQLALA